MTIATTTADVISAFAHIVKSTNNDTKKALSLLKDALDGDFDWPNIHMSNVILSGAEQRIIRSGDIPTITQNGKLLFEAATGLSYDDGSSDTKSIPSVDPVAILAGVKPDADTKAVKTKGSKGKKTDIKNDVSAATVRAANKMVKDALGKQGVKTIDELFSFIDSRDKGLTAMKEALARKEPITSELISGVRGLDTAISALNNAVLIKENMKAVPKSGDFNVAGATIMPDDPITIFLRESNHEMGDLTAVIDLMQEMALAIQTTEKELRERSASSRMEVSASKKSNASESGIVTKALASTVFTTYDNFEDTGMLDFDIPLYMVGDEDRGDVPEIDPSYQFFGPVLAEALHTISSNEIMWLYGDSGSGKSAFWQQLAARLGMPFTRMNMDGHLTRSDIVGVNRLLPGPNGSPEMRFIDGMLTRAMTRPGLLLIDELDLGDPEIMPILQPILEGEPLRLLEDGGREVRQHPLFRIAVTGNSTGLGSGAGGYVNVHEQSAATRDRMACYVYMPYLPPEIEVEVAMTRCPGASRDFMKKMVQLAEKIRHGFSQGEIGQTLSTRGIMAAAARQARLGPIAKDKAALEQSILDVVVLNRMDETSRPVVIGLIDNIFG